MRLFSGRIAILALAWCLATMTSRSSAAPQQAATPPSPLPFESLRTQAEEARLAGRIDQAVTLYQQALALQPSWTEGYWSLGTIYYDADRHVECRDAFTHVVEQEPEHGAAWAFRGLCEFKVQEYSSALEHLNRAKQLGVGGDPSFQAVVGYHRAILMARAEEFERALEVDAAFVRGGNTNPEILEALGIALLRLPMLPSEVPPGQRDMVKLAGRAGALSIGMQRDAAERALVQLVATYPDAPNVHYVYGTHLASDRPAEALEQFKIELTRWPNHVHARVQIAQELIKQGEFEAAAPYAAEAARLAPKNFMARKVLGQVKLQAGDAVGAVTELEAARALEPSSPSVRFHLARAYQRAGRTADATRERTEFRRLEALQQVQRGANAVGDEVDEQKPQ
jgi:tetratricopeptide (TPR) repeat protein